MVSPASSSLRSLHGDVHHGLASRISAAWFLRFPCSRNLGKSQFVFQGSKDFHLCPQRVTDYLKETRELMWIKSPDSVQLSHRKHNSSNDDVSRKSLTRRGPRIEHITLHRCLAKALGKNAMASEWQWSSFLSDNLGQLHPNASPLISTPIHAPCWGEPAGINISLPLEGWLCTLREIQAILASTIKNRTIMPLHTILESTLGTLENPL